MLVWILKHTNKITYDDGTYSITYLSHAHKWVLEWFFNGEYKRYWGKTENECMAELERLKRKYGVEVNELSLF